MSHLKATVYKERPSGCSSVKRPSAPLSLAPQWPWRGLCMFHDCRNDTKNKRQASLSASMFVRSNWQVNSHKNFHKSFHGKVVCFGIRLRFFGFASALSLPFSPPFWSLFDLVRLHHSRLRWGSWTFVCRRYGTVKPGHYSMMRPGEPCSTVLCNPAQKEILLRSMALSLKEACIGLHLLKAWEGQRQISLKCSLAWYHTLKFYYSFIPRGLGTA